MVGLDAVVLRTVCLGDSVRLGAFSSRACLRGVNRCRHGQLVHLLGRLFPDLASNARSQPLGPVALGGSDLHRCHLTLWALYRRALDFLPFETAQLDQWIYRICDKGFKSRGGLGAHFFKVHQREASHRGLLTGTTCLACGRD